MNEALVKAGWTAGKSVVRYLEGVLDPGKRRYLEEQIEQHVLSEIPRIKAELEARMSEIEAAGCTPEEAVVLAHQAIEEQKRTVDEGKRRRLSNVLVNGLCAAGWQKAKHRLLIRFASELEEEHVDLLKRPVQHHARGIEIALQRELIARGLLEVQTTQVENPQWKPRPLGERQAISPLLPRRHEPEFTIHETIRISVLGREFLEHLRDPTSPLGIDPDV